MKVLIACASKYGSTRGIADFIGEKLRLRGMDVDVRDIDKVDNIAIYNAFVVGSALYMGHWMKEAKQFLSKNTAILADHPVWLFSSGPTSKGRLDDKGHDLLEVSGPTELKELQELAKPRDHHVFFGAFNGANLTGTYRLFFSLAQHSKSARESMGEGDFRDWNEIEAWTNKIAEILEANTTAVAPVAMNAPSPTRG